MHISLDFWNTIGIPNPRYAEARNSILGEVFNCHPDIASHIYKEVKATVDKTHSADCKPLDMRTIYSFLNHSFIMEGFKCLEYPNPSLPIRARLEKAFREHPPIILEATKEQLNRISKFATLSIGSNTNFIRGAIISEILPSVFKFKLFSDEVGYAKPHCRFWSRILDNVPLSEKVIHHIGDHPVCDKNTIDHINPIIIQNAYKLPGVLSEFEAV